MSKKLEELQEEGANAFDRLRGKALNDARMGHEAFNGYIVGWDAAMKLNLPVFFLEWVTDNFTDTDYAMHKCQCADVSELYGYWLEHIYNPE